MYEIGKATSQVSLILFVCILILFVQLGCYCLSRIRIVICSLFLLFSVVIVVIKLLIAAKVI